jgi:hypothetical protein
VQFRNADRYHLQRARVLAAKKPAQEGPCAQAKERFRMTARHLVAFLSSVLLAAGCHDRSVADAARTAGSPIAPTKSAPLPEPANGANWTASATVTLVKQGTTPPCGWGTSVGETRTGVDWRISLTADQVSLDEDMRNWPTDDIPFTGRLSGVQFTASYSSGSNYANFVCQFREGSISGSFNSDFSTFDAVETLIWGMPGSETIVERHWVGSRL